MPAPPAARNDLMRSMPAVLLVLLALVALSIAPGNARAAGLQAAPCPFALDKGDGDAGRIACGHVAVPRDPADPSAGQFKLRVVVIRAASPSQLPPLFFAHGGPGAAISQWGGRPGMRRLAPERDVVLWDQRGAGGSEPFACKETVDTLLRDFAAPGALSEVSGRWNAAYRACGRELRAAGFREDMFGTAVNVQDMDALRRALGYRQVALYGPSYGGTLALEALARVSQSLRLVVLDSAYPPDAMLLGLDDSVDRAIAQLSARCTAYAPCRARWPDLAAAYPRLRADLDARPLPVPVSGFGAPVVSLSGAKLDFLVLQLIQSPDTRMLVPALLDAARRRDAAGFAPALAVMATSLRDLTPAGALTVECRDRPRWRDAAPITRGAQLQEPRAACVAFGAPGPAAPQVANPGNVPVLVLAGAFDGLSVPDYAVRLAASLGPRAQARVLRDAGHSGALRSACGRPWFNAFLRDPGAPLAACTVNRAPALQPQGTSRPVRGVGRIAAAAALGEAPVVVAPLLGLGALAVLLGLLWPLLLWAARRAHAWRGRTPAWVAALAVLVSLGTYAWRLLAAMQVNPAFPMVGLQAGDGWVTVLPWLPAMVAAVALLRRRRKAPTSAWIAIAAAAGFSVAAAWLGFALPFDRA